MAIYKLGEVCTYVEGYVNPSINDQENFDKNGKMFWLKVADLSHGNKINSTTNKLSQKAIDSIKNDSQIFKAGSIVWSKSGSVGLASILDVNVTANRGILNIVPNNKIENKYLFYILIKNKEIFASKATGAVLKHFYGPNLMAERIFVPSIAEQRQIIDIIEPIELQISVVENKLKTLKKILVSNYYSSNNHKISLNQVVELVSNKYDGQSEYFATDAFGEMSIDNNSKQDISKAVPSRANLTPASDSIIISKLDGENKIFYFEKRPGFVVSTGFFNIRTKYNDHFIGFLLSDDFKMQKSINSTGTTMRGLNNPSFLSIQILQPQSESSDITQAISKLIDIKNKLEQLKSTSIRLLIK